MKALRLATAVSRTANWDKFQLKGSNIGKIVRFMVVAVTIIASTNFYLLDAAYLRNVPQTLTQPDGSVLNCFATGDEFYNWLHDAEGYTIIRNPETGFYVYADKDNVSDELITTNLVVGIDKPQTSKLQTHLLHSKEYIANKRESWFNFKQQFPKKSKKQDGFQGSSPFDTINQIVILVTWNNGPSFHNPLSFYDTIYNHNPNSFKAYWLEQSYNQLTVNTYLYEYQSPYTRNQLVYGIGCYGEFINDIIANVADSISSDLNIDYNNDGFLDNISVILQGQPVGWNSILWPHSVGSHSFLEDYPGWGLGYHPFYCEGYVMSDDPFYQLGPVNGKLLNTFNLNFEWGSYTSGSTPPTNILNVLCHEFFHTFEAPDLYVNAGIERVGVWSLMSDGGNYLTMYEKYQYGKWLDSIPTIDSNGTYTLQHCKQDVANNCYKINSLEDANYYFVLEHRNLEKEHHLGGFLVYQYENTGLLIYRINKNRYGHGNYYGDAPETIGELYVYRPDGTNTNNGSLHKALYGDTYTHNDLIRNIINDTTTELTTSFLEGGFAGGLDISDIYIYSGNDSVSFVVGGFNEPVIIEHPISQEVLEKDILYLSIEAIYAKSYQWQQDEIDIPGATSNVYVKPNVQLEDSGNYRCIAINSMGRDTSDVAVITVIPVYTITITIDSNGTVSSIPEDLTDLPIGTICTLFATADTGCIFTSWTRKDTDSVISTDNPYIFEITSNDSLVANFIPIEYIITYNLNGGEGIMMPQTYTIKTETFSLPSPTRIGYIFGGWFEREFEYEYEYEYEYHNDDTIEIIIEIIDTIEIDVAEIIEGSTGDKEFFARWIPIVYNIVYHPNGGEGIMEPTSYTIETTAIGLPPITKAGYTFGGWYDNAKLDGNSILQIPQGSYGDKEFFAKWNPIAYNITYYLNGGYGLLDPLNYTIETPTIKLFMPTRTGYTFAGWYTNSSLSGSPVAEIPKGSIGNKTLWAKWSINTYTIMASSGPNGTISPTGRRYADYGSYLTFTFIPNTGYQVDVLTIDGYVVPTTTSYTFTSISNHHSINITFKELTQNQFYLALHPEPFELGKVKGDGVYDSGSVRTISAIPNQNARFVKWTYNGVDYSTKADTTVLINSSKTLVAHFALNTNHKYKVTLNTNPYVGGNAISNKELVDSGETCTIEATANANYKFVNWTANGNIISTANPLTIKVIRDTTITANFEKTTDELPVITTHPESKTLTEGETLNLYIAATGNNMLYQWYKNNSEIPLENSSYYTKPNVSIEDEGIYSCKVWNSGGEVMSNPATVNVLIGVKEYVKLETLLISPNPTSDNFTFSLDILKAANMQISVSDLADKKILDVYDGFVDAGTFSKTIKTNKLSKGVYFLKITIAGNTFVEKIIVN